MNEIIMQELQSNPEMSMRNIVALYLMQKDDGDILTVEDIVKVLPPPFDTRRSAVSSSLSAYRKRGIIDHVSTEPGIGGKFIYSVNRHTYELLGARSYRKWGRGNGKGSTPGYKKHKVDGDILCGAIEGMNLGYLESEEKLMGYYNGEMMWPDPVGVQDAARPATEAQVPVESTDRYSELSTTLLGLAVELERYAAELKKPLDRFTSDELLAELGKRVRK